VRPGDLFGYVRPASVTVTFCDRKWDIDLDCAHAWIGAVGFDLESLAGVFPGAIRDDQTEIMHQLSLSCPDIDRRWINTGRAAVGRGGGRDWWWTVALIRKALSGWPYINGRLLLSGVDSRRLPLPDWLDACYMMLWQNCDEKERIKLDTQLSMPPKGIAVRRSAASTKQMLDDFAAD
jgi:hypothetical protein